MNWLILAASITLTWVPPTTNEDGTPLTDLAGYRVYYSEAAGVAKDPANLLIELDTTVCADEAKTYYFAVSAFDLSGNESKLSNEASKAITVNNCVHVVDFSKLEVK